MKNAVSYKQVLTVCTTPDDVLIPLPHKLGRGPHYIHQSARVATNLDTSGSLKSCQNLMEDPGIVEHLLKNLENSGKM